MTTESFTLDMEPFSHLMTNNDLNSSSRNNNSNLSTKELQIKVQKMNTDIPSSKDSSLMGCAMTIKSMLQNRTTDHIPDPEVHHQISIESSATTATKNPAITRTKSGKKSNSFKQSSIISPRRILFLFATLSSMGTFLLICLNLSLAKYNEDCN